jgi:ubiquitin-protein ligase
VLPFVSLLLGLSRLPFVNASASAKEVTSRAPLPHAAAAATHNASLTADVPTETYLGTPSLLTKKESDAHKVGVPKLTRAKRPKTKTASSAKRLSSEEATSLRRIQSEWKDLVQAGMAFDWKRRKPVSKETSAERGSANSRVVHPHHVWVGPLSKNLWVWHFSFLGLAGTPYEGGIYHGRLILPKDYPGSPPKVQVWTPTGRFVPRADICLSASDFHPETWTASWTVRTLIESLRLHMLTTANEIGGLQASHAQKVTLARASRRWRAMVGPPATVVDHASMVLGGLFPARDEEDEDEEDAIKLTSSSPMVAKDVPTSLSSASSAQVRLSDAHAVSNRDSPLGLLALLRSPLRMALLSLCLLFVVLNTR